MEETAEKVFRKQFTLEMFEILKITKSINAKLYNYKGLVLIYPKANASPVEMEKLRNFILSGGVYFNSDEELILLGPSAASKPVSVPEPVKEEKVTKEVESNAPEVEGLSNVRLISRKTADELSQEALDLFSELKTTSLLSSRSGTLKVKLEKVFRDFNNHPDAMNGLVNIIDLIGGMDMMPDPQKAVKRTVVAMAMKTRGMKAQTNKDRSTFDHMVTDLMMSAMLCDVGFLRMKSVDPSLPESEKLRYEKSHPLYSYLLIAQDDSLSANVKFTVLSHHRSLLDNTVASNNYPDVLWLREKLKTFDKNYKNEENKNFVHLDVETQLANLQKGIYYDEDISIVALASAFAELTTEDGGHHAKTSVMAVRDIINQAFFNYPDRIVKEFLDHISMSLCNNQKIINENDYVILASYSADKSILWEVGRVHSSSRWQSRPVVICFATLRPVVQKEPELSLTGFEIESIKTLFRPILVHLDAEFQRRIVYLLHPKEDEKLHLLVNTLYRNTRVPSDMLERTRGA